MKKIALGMTMAVLACAAWADDPPQRPLPPGLAKKLMERCDSCATVQEVRHERRKGEGAAGGIVFAGSEIQKQVTKKDVWVTRVRMRDGSERNFEQEQPPRWQQGHVVRIKGDRLAKL